MCIEVKRNSVYCKINEELCIGCTACQKSCPYNAIKIENLPQDLETQITHRYGSNAFKLHGLPILRQNEVLGLVGTNGIGKTTALNILSGIEMPNLGYYDNPPDWKMILKSYRGTESQKLFIQMSKNNIKTVKKVQDVDAY